MFFDWGHQSILSVWNWMGLGVVHASNDLILKPTGLPNTTLTTSGIIVNVGNVVIQVISVLAGVLAVAYLIWAGLQYIMSGGDPEKAKKGRVGVINAVIGIIIIVATYTIVRFAVSAGNTINNGVNSSSSDSPTPTSSPTPTLLP